MKKWLIGAGIALVAIGLVVGGAAFAASRTAAVSERARTVQDVPFLGGRQGALQRGPMGGMGFRGQLHDIVFEALADGLGLSVDDLQTALAEGQSLAEIAADAGVTEAELPEFLQEVRAAALAKAVAEGLITQEQADWMAQHPFSLRMFATMRRGWSDGGRGPIGDRQFGAW